MRWVAVPLVLGLFAATGCRPADVSAPPTTAAPEVIPPGVGSRYEWRLAGTRYEPVARRFPCPAGFKRVPVARNSWGEWLRYLPLRAPGTPVRGLDGIIVASGDDPSVGAVLDLDVRKYQECADVIFRLRAEWLRWKRQEKAIAFRTTDGPVLSWDAWKAGTRVRQVGDHLLLTKGARPDASRRSFDRYLFSVFCWCGTVSLINETDRIAPQKLMPGDVFIESGSPGHVVLVLDVAKDAAGRRKGLIAQGYLPAQSAHVVAADGRAWLDLDPFRPVDVPRYGQFQWGDLRRLHPARPLGSQG